jgi:predicted DNA binding CopG/RHH family protein
MNLKLDDEEKELLESFENDEWISVENKDEILDKHAEYAKALIKKDERVYFQISQRDLRILKSKSLEEGISYQSLISAIIHKFLSGRLVEKV